MSSEWSRRDFLEFMGRGTIAASALSFPLTGVLGAGKSKIPTVAPVISDRVVLADGLSYELLLKHGDPINSKERFGDCADYTAFFPINEREGLLWVNHESFMSTFVTGRHYKDLGWPRSFGEVIQERKEVGGSVIAVRKDDGGKWQFQKDHPLNWRMDATTIIPFAGGKIANRDKAVGTLGNCAGGVTPWGTVLTCEEQHKYFYGDVRQKKDGSVERTRSSKGWESVYPLPAEHFGWVVEVNPKTRAARKLIAMGRFGHECAHVVPTKDGRIAVYSGDDRKDGCIYKFISDKPNSVESGELYVADTKNGRWISLDREKTPALKKKFGTQTDVMIFSREAALEVGGSKHDRPEDIETDPVTGAVLIALTNNYSKKNYFGSILKIEEKNADSASLTFRAKTFLSGGTQTGFACPDNLAFDPSGNLWVTSDISGRRIGSERFESFGNNGLFFVPMKGENAGNVFQIASAPIEAEFTGPTFTPDGKTLFLSVQHPGEATKNPKKPTSRWPSGTGTPKSAVIAISNIDRISKLS